MHCKKDYNLQEAWVGCIHLKGTNTSAFWSVLQMDFIFSGIFSLSLNDHTFCVELILNFQQIVLRF